MKDYQKSDRDLNLIERVKFYLLGLVGHGKHCDRALDMAHMHHEHSKVHYESCDKCKVAVDFMEPMYGVAIAHRDKRNAEFAAQQAKADG